ncbi:hypothetical protein [Microseira wollei]|uniref:Uncharacterized protein n=1 Tax=Microseira wollei NIES-4236 TaxID=2530354 RepID=A0AAV3X971_9CYAN|nr:hypothetical protein [Microseira wollei]GET38963.1 hypothetical protein MiSe_37230 [Microseira wollei NIES-4236]
MARKTGLKVLHAMPGRVRLGVTGGDKTDAYLLSDQLDALAQRLQQQEGIRNVSANAKTGSLTVNFDPSTLSLSRLLERLQQWGVLASAALPSQQPKQDFSFLQSGDFWQEQLNTIIPIVAGLLIVRALKLQGLWTIPVYVLAASFTRKLMQQLERDLIVPLAVAETVGKSKVKVSQSENKVNQNGDEPPSIGPEIIAASQPLQFDNDGHLGNAIAYRLAHAIPGRLRFHVERVATDSEYARRLELLAQEDPWVTSLKINRKAASVTFTYVAGANKDTKGAVARVANLIQAAGEVAVPSVMAPFIPTPPPPTKAEEIDASSTLAEQDAGEEAVLPTPEVTEDLVAEETSEEGNAIADSPTEPQVSEVTEQISDITEETQSSDNETTTSNELRSEEPSILAPAVAKFYSRLKQCIAKIVSRLSSVEWFEVHPRDAPNAI